MTLILIILIILVVIYFYYQRKKLNLDSSFTSSGSATNADLTEFNQVKQANQALEAFLSNQLNSNSLEELQAKLNEKTLNELIEENEDFETEIDLLTRTKNSLEADLLAQSNGFQNRLREKDREVKKLKEDLTNEQKRLQNAQQSLASEKAQHKGSLTRITKLTEQITNLEQKKQQIKQQHTEQLRMINLLFDDKAKDYKEIDFNGLYELLSKVAQKDLPGSFPQEKKDD
jgi:chromosome segregation ATPase